LHLATLHIQKIPLEARCAICQVVFRPERFRFECPVCGSRETSITQGDAVTLESVDVESLPAGEFA
jgi:Zn finger protein HypA/HybF involved in hydrogenase expression